MSYNRVIAIYYKDSRLEGCNGNDYVMFLDMIHQHAGGNNGNRIYFQDNARIHGTVEVRNYIAENNMRFVNNVPYCSDFNAIEGLFNIVKNIARNSLFILIQTNARIIFRSICERIDRRKISNLVDATYARFARCLL